MKKVRKILMIVFSVCFFLTGNNFVFAVEEYTENLIPKMTSDTSPSGIASSSSNHINEYQEYKPWLAFNHTTSGHLDSWFIQAGTTTGWLAYEFDEPKIIAKYTIEPRDYYGEISLKEIPKDWRFEGWDGEKWVILDSRTNVTKWTYKTKNEFTFDNSTAYKKYRLNITANNGHPTMTGLGELEMMAKSTTTPGPKPEPTGNKALLVINMVSGVQKEYDMTMKEIKDFIDWYEDRASGNGKEAYIINKNYNIGPFLSRKDHIAFSKIESFEVKEYQ